jgi:hypothetical protein
MSCQNHVVSVPPGETERSTADYKNESGRNKTGDCRQKAQTGQQAFQPHKTNQAYSRFCGHRTLSILLGGRALSLHNQWRVVVEHQLPVPLLLYPYPRKAVFAGNSFASVLPVHCGEAGLDSRVPIDAHLNFVGGDGLKFQFTERKIGNHLRLGSHGAAWSYADKISSIDALKGRRISIDLRLNAFLIELPYDLLNASSSIRARARSLA